MSENQRKKAALFPILRSHEDLQDGPPLLDETLRRNSPPGFHLMAKPSGSTCNIDCKYCFFLSKESLYPNDKSRMSEATLETYIRQLLESHRTPVTGTIKRVMVDVSDRSFEELSADVKAKIAMATQ